MKKIRYNTRLKLFKKVPMSINTFGHQLFKAFFVLGMLWYLSII